MGIEDQPRADAGTDRPGDPAGRREAVDPSRRSLLTAGSALLMTGGLVGGYGTFLAMAGRYLFPSDRNKAWVFVSDQHGIAPGASKAFVSPTGVQVTVTRRADASPNEPPKAEDFLALSSICPHLGCRVHWEPHNERFFCPCHNGVFDPDGKAVSGPPAAAGQNLAQYPLRIENGSLFIEMPLTSVGERRGSATG